MNQLLFISFFIFLVLIAKYFYWLNAKVGAQEYLKHMIFESASTQTAKTSFYKNIKLADILAIGVVSLYILKEDGISLHLWQATLAFFVMIYVIIFTLSFSSYLVFKYAAQHPGQISGQTHFKSGLFWAIQRSVLLQLTIPCAALTIMTPSFYSYGALGGLILMLVLAVLSSFKHPIY